MTAGLLHSPDEEVRRAGVAALRAGDEELGLLVEALGDESWRVRKEAVLRAAAWSERDRAAALLVTTLAESENVGRRNAAVEALARIGGPAVGPLLAELEKGPEHRKLVVDTLGLIGDRRAAAALIASLDDTDPNVCAATADALGRIGGLDAEAALVRGIERGELLLSLACLQALNSLRAPLPVERLLPLLVTPVLLPVVLGALGNSRDAGAATPLASHLGDRSRAAREAATVGLAYLWATLEEAERRRVAAALHDLSEEARQWLVEALLEGVPETRRAAACVLGACGAPSAVRPLVLALGDPEIEAAAARGLSDLGSEAIGALAAMADGVDPSVRLAIFRLVPSLRSAADPRLQTTLGAAIADSDAEVAAEAVRALGGVGGPSAIAVVMRALTREDIGPAAEEALIALATRYSRAVRAAVLDRGFAGDDARYLCRVLGVCGREDDAAVLQRLLGADAAPLRAAASAALALLAGERAHGELVAALADPSPEVRAASARAVSDWPSGRNALAARESLEEDPLVRAVIAAALARPG